MDNPTVQQWQDSAVRVLLEKKRERIQERLAEIERQLAERETDPQT
jgi:hypothetical protein